MNFFEADEDDELSTTDLLRCSDNDESGTLEPALLKIDSG
jgi:hypothetical protein